jgi:hypothetical protein
MSPATARRILRRVGHRGAFLAVLDAGFGYSLLGEPSAVQQAQDLALPLPAWGWLWIGVGVVCAVYAFTRPARDTPAFGIAAALKFAWAAAEIRAGLLAPEPRWWVSPMIFGTFALTTIVIASWPEPAGRNGARGDQRV